MFTVHGDIRNWRSCDRCGDPRRTPAYKCHICSKWRCLRSCDIVETCSKCGIPFCSKCTDPRNRKYCISCATSPPEVNANVDNRLSQTCGCGQFLILAGPVCAGCKRPECLNFDCERQLRTTRCCGHDYCRNCSIWLMNKGFLCKYCPLPSNVSIHSSR